MSSGDSSSSSLVSSIPSIFQVFTFYDAYLDNFYANRPALAHAPFSTQMQELYRDGFGVLHVYAPALAELGSRASWVIANCEQAQRRWAAENGVQVSAANWRDEILRAQIKSFAPDALYFLNSIDFDSRFTRTLETRPKAVIGWRAADIAPDIDWSDFDLIVSHLSVCREQAIRHGARQTEYFHPSVPKFLAEVTASHQREFDVVFTGQWTPQHHERNQIINAVAEASEREGFSFGLFLSSHGCTLPPAVARCNRGARWGQSMYQALRSGRVVLNAEIDLAAGEAGNMRLFETASVGSFLLTQHQRNIARYFTPGLHIDTYQSVTELLEKVRYYLKNSTQREAMALAAQQHIQTAFSPLVGAQKLLGFCSALVHRETTIKKDPLTTPAQPKLDMRVELVLDIALSELSAGKFVEALLLVEQVGETDKPVRDLQFVRGLCFGKLARFSEAAGALEKELIFFPDNMAARELLMQVRRSA